MRRVVMSVVLGVIVASTARGQQTPKAFVPASASTTKTRNSSLSLTEQMRRRPDILNGESLDVTSRYGLVSEFRAMGERIGGRFHRSYKIVVHPGDLVRIPAVVPHAFIVSGKEPLDYLVIKQRRLDLPVRWKGDR
jgi:hypothetical protein